MQVGWVKIHRSLLEHWLYDQKPFCYAGAWIDLLLRANHEPKKLKVGDQLKTIERGQLFTSYRSLSEHWGWSVKKIRTFLTLLYRDRMIELEVTKEGTLLTIENYEVYQESGNAKETQRERKGNTEETQREREENAERTQRERNKNIKNVKNDKNDKNEKNEKNDSVPKKSFGTFNHVKLTEDELNRLKGDFGETITEQAITFLDAYIEEKGYKSKSHNLAIRRWVINAVKENQAKQTKANRTQPQEQESIAERWANVE